MTTKPRPLPLPGIESGLGPGKIPNLDLEKKYKGMGFGPVAGVDEAGRGPLAGPVVAAAVVLPDHVEKNSPLHQVNDSKKLSRQRREAMYEIVVAEAEDMAWAICDPEEIDRMNILAASLEAMRRAIMDLDPTPAICLVDGRDVLRCQVPSVPVIKGDAICLSIAAASILAKVIRDRIMEELDRKYPAYGFAGHKGYPTKAHKKAILENGPCPVHRKTFSGVKECL